MPKTGAVTVMSTARAAGTARYTVPGKDPYGTKWWKGGSDSHARVKQHYKNNKVKGQSEQYQYNKGGISMRKLDKKKGVEGGRKKRIRLPCGEVHGCRSRARWARVGPAAREGGAPVGDPADRSTAYLKRNCHTGLFTLVCHSSTQHQTVPIRELSSPLALEAFCSEVVPQVYWLR